jgi:PAS domain S-box-containing protein
MIDHIRGLKMKKHTIHSSGNPNEDVALRIILEGTATETGERFFEALVVNLSKALNTSCAWVTEYLEESRRLRALAFWAYGEFIHEFEVNIDGTPCEDVIDNTQLIHYPDNILELFPNNPNLKQLGAVSYIGVPLMDLDGKVLGHLAVLDNQPMSEEPESLAIFRIFAARAAVELQRLRAASEVKDREEKLSRLVNSAMDAIVELDRNFNVVLLNPAAEKVFYCRMDKTAACNFLEFLDRDSREKLISLIEKLDAGPEDRQYLWVPGSLKAYDVQGREFTAEATLSRFEMGSEVFYSLILRNVNERIEAEQKIRSLTEETEYLREEIKAHKNFDEIIGQSRPLIDVLKMVSQVARTEASVLIQGETGVGKELVAHAIHQNSRRSDKPFIQLNCAALPPNLVESELFGHEPGAFTGASKLRKGRFELADGGTIFLDEISELPLDVQAKMLHVLQEGQFERVGGSTTLTADVRVITATNRNLGAEIIAGRFRADLFYRLNVYPVTVPPLRDRREDIPLLVKYFIPRIANRIGKTVHQISPSTMNQLIEYDWPGNIRELKNVVERAIITSAGAELQLPKQITGMASSTVLCDKGVDFSTLERVERQHISSVLQATGWRISGPKGAAKILDINPSTLRFRIKKLGIQKPGATYQPLYPSPANLNTP